MNRLISWWRRVSPWARAHAANVARAEAQSRLLLVSIALRTERERNEQLIRITRRDAADLEALAEQLGQAWDARDSARRVAVTLDNENRCAMDLLHMAYGTLAKLADDPPEVFTRPEQDLHYWIGAFLRTQASIPGERHEPAKAGG